MKKLIYIIPLVLLLALLAACGAPETTTVTTAPSSGIGDSIKALATGAIPCNGNYNNGILYDINQGGEITLHIEEWNEDRFVSAVPLSSDMEIEAFRRTQKAIAINNERACLFLQRPNEITVVRFEKGSPSETVTSLEVSESVIGIEGNFINENIGYLFAFTEEVGGHSRGSSKLSNFFKTEDGGNTWNAIDVQYVPLLDLRNYIIFAKMISEDVGLISGNIFGADYDFCERTLLTTDGGLNWVNVSDLPQINDLQWSIVTDFSRVDNSYVLTVRYIAKESNGEYDYAEYKLTDSKNWIRIS